MTLAAIQINKSNHISVPQFETFEEPIREWGERDTLDLLNWAIREKAKIAINSKKSRKMQVKDIKARMGQVWRPLLDRPKDRAVKKLKQMIGKLTAEQRIQLDEK